MKDIRRAPVNNAIRETFRQLSDHIIADELNYASLKQAIADLHQLLAGIGGVEAYANELKVHNTNLAGGVAISPQMAAFCSTDIARTRTFLRGVKSGIEHLLHDFPGVTLQIVYAGTGPYALLVFPLLHHFQPSQVQFTLLDIHQESIDSVNKILYALGLEAFIRDVQKTDACTWTWEGEGDLHACISETMQATLKREPQVAITMNMADYIAPKGLMLPELVEVEAMLVHRRDNPEMEVVQQFSLGKVATLNLERARKANHQVNYILHGVKANLPQDIGVENFVLELHTHIKVWESHSLKAFESGLTIPYLITEGGNLSGVQNIELYYDQWPDAKVCYKVSARR